MPRANAQDARIVVTGCAAQIDPDGWAALPDVDRVLGNEDKLKPESWLPERRVGGFRHHGGARNRRRIWSPNSPAVRAPSCRCNRAATTAARSASFHSAAAPTASVPIGAVVSQVRALAGAGYREVVLTGVDIASYGSDLPGTPRSGRWSRRLLALVPELPRLRLSSLDPAAIDDDLWRLIAEEPRLMPHLHLSLQAGSDLILKRMKRRHVSR